MYRYRKIGTMFRTGWVECSLVPMELKYDGKRGWAAGRDLKEKGVQKSIVADLDQFDIDLDLQ